MGIAKFRLEKKGSSGICLDGGQSYAPGQGIGGQHDLLEQIDIACNLPTAFLQELLDSCLLFLYEERGVLKKLGTMIALKLS